MRSPRSSSTTPSRIPRWPRSSRASPRRTVLPFTTNTAMSSTTSASCSQASIRRPSNMSALNAVIKAQIAQVEADKRMSPNDKKKALVDLNEALRSPAVPIENQGNIDLVAKYYDKLADALGNDEE